MADETTPQDDNQANFGVPNNNESIPTPPVAPIPPTPPSPPTPPLAPTPEAHNATTDSTYPSVPQFATNVIQAKKKSGGKKIVLILIAILAIAAIASIAVFAFNAFSSSTGGSDTPEGVINNFADGAKDKDLPAMLSALDPNEIEPFIENLDTFTKSAKQDGAIKNEKNPLEAYNINFNNVKTETVKYSDNVARVELISGMIKVKVDKSKLPRDSSAKSNTINIEQSNKDYIKALKNNSEDFRVSDLESKHIFYIAVKRGDLWYASSLYTATEYARLYFNATGENIEQPTFDENERVGNGATSSNEAVKNFLGAIVGLNTEKIIDATAPERFSIGYDYKQTLLDLQKENEDNQYLKIAEDAVTITDLETTATANGKDREFNKIDSVKVKVKYNIDVLKGEENLYTYFPYSVDVKGSWDGKCYEYSGEVKNYAEVDNSELNDYSFDDEAPYTDAAGVVYNESYDVYKAQFPIVSANGHIYPTEDSTYFDTYHALPWTDDNGNVVYDASGNKVATATGNYEADDQQNYPWKDSADADVYNKYGYEAYADPVYTYEKQSTNVDDKNCLSNKDLKELPDFGFVTIKENGKYYVSPIDTIWYYVIWGVKNN